MFAVEIAMDNPLLVRRLERLGDLAGDAQRFVDKGARQADG